MTSRPAQKLTVTSAIGMAASGFVGVYTGLTLLFPMSGAALAWWLGRKALPESRHSVVPALAIQTGHALWIALGLMIIGTLDANVLDPVILLVGVAWLALRPGNPPIYFLAAFQIFAVVVNASAFVQATVGTSAHKALLVQLFLRVLALIWLGQLWLQLRKVATATNDVV
jgi:hypothetical protein